MTRVDFYLLAAGCGRSVLQTACMLIEKAIAGDQAVHVHTDCSHQATELDQALWSFKADSFIPHLMLDRATHPQAAQLPPSKSPGNSVVQVNALAESTTEGYSLAQQDIDQTRPSHQLVGYTIARHYNDSDIRVTIGTTAVPACCDGVLINLAKEVPAFFSHFPRTLEIVDGSDSAKALSRSRYRYYQSRGYPLKHHNLGKVVTPAC